MELHKFARNGCGASVVSPQDGGTALKLVVFREMDPAIGPVLVYRHVRRLASGETRAGHSHAS